MNTTEQSRNPADTQAEKALDALAAVRSDLVQSASLIDRLEREMLPDVFGEFARTLDESSKRDGALVIMTRLVKSLCDAVREKIPIAEPNDLLENVKSLVVCDPKDAISITASLKRTRLTFGRKMSVAAKVGAVCERLRSMSKEPKMQSDTIRVLELHDEALSYLRENLKMSLEGPDVGSAWKNKPLETLEEWATFAIYRKAYWMSVAREHEQTIHSLEKARDAFKRANSDQREMIKKLRDDVENKGDYVEELDAEVDKLKTSNSDQLKLIDKITKEREELTRKLREPYAEDQRLRDDNERLKLELEDARNQRVEM